MLNGQIKTEQRVTPATEADSELEFTGVSHYFLTAQSEPFLAVNDINLHIPREKFVAVIGPSGCGKSTLLNMAAGLLTPTHGTVTHRGAPIDSVNTSVGYVPQHDLLLPWRTVEKNVGLSLEIQGIAPKLRRERVAEALRVVGLEQSAKRYPAQLSGGMRKRTALARVLIYEPDTLLMDEPFSALDAQLRLVMQQELLELWSRHRKTVIFVTHDLDEAILLADTVVVFGQAPGEIIHVQDIPLARPRDFDALRADPDFAAIWRQLWTLLEAQMSAEPGSGGSDDSD